MVVTMVVSMVVFYYFEANIIAPILKMQAPL